jgi:hypothetical protein
MAKCWEQRGCDEEMQAECAHASVFHDRCPTKCAFATCSRATYVVTSDPELLFSTEIDHSKAIKEGCLHCEFFLTHGPRRG